VPTPEDDLPIELELLKTERDKLKDSLRETEAELRKMEADVKLLRQREIQTKREIEALSTLVELKEGREPKPTNG
jgi:predicted  nucleic acid-binding Zn-ribbon protein